MLSRIYGSKKRCSFEGSSYSREEQRLGLRILIVNLANASSKQQLVVKPAGSKMVKPIFALDQTIQSTTSSHSCDNRHDDRYASCYLRSCHLCHKTLALDKEVYMYRGDLGFCSVECRDRQIYIDEMKETEISTQKVVASFRQQCRRDGGGGRCHNDSIFEGFRQPRHPFSSQNNRVVFS